MNRVFQIARREFVTTVFTKAFLIGLIMLPVMIAIFALVGPRLFQDRDFAAEGRFAVVDPTGRVMPHLRVLASEGGAAVDVPEEARAAAETAASLGIDVEQLAAGPALTLVERPADVDVEAEKARLGEQPDGSDNVAFAIVHDNAVEAGGAGVELGAYDLYVPPGQDARAEQAVHRMLREAIVSARLQLRGLDPELIGELTSVARVRSVTVTEEAERDTVAAFNVLMPFAFMFLLFISVFGSGQGLLTTTIEEKSSRVVEVLLSAVSPMQLMAGKLLGHMGISLLGLSVYIALGLVALTSFSMFGLLDASLIFYLFVFFVLTFLMIGSFMMAAGAAVNELAEAQSLMMPVTLLMIVPWFAWMPISRDPDSTLSLVVSLVPPINAFGMILRLASPEPPPAWQIWLSVGFGLVAVVGTLWFSAKVFRIGLLRFGKAPNLRTMIRWARAA